MTKSKASLIGFVVSAALLGVTYWLRPMPPTPPGVAAVVWAFLVIEFFAIWAGIAFAIRAWRSVRISWKEGERRHLGAYLAVLWLLLSWLPYSHALAAMNTLVASLWVQWGYRASIFLAAMILAAWILPWLEVRITVPDRSKTSPDRS